MIDKEKFNDLFQSLDAKIIVELIDLFAAQQPEVINFLQQSIENYNIIEIKKLAHKFKGTCAQFYDPVSSKHAGIMEEAAHYKILEIVDNLILDYPASLREMRKNLDDNDFVKKALKSPSLKVFLEGFTDSVSQERILKMESLEKLMIMERMPQMFADLEVSSAQLNSELQQIKKELIS
ncbi:MAG: hypothetical protein ACOYNC_01740 [Bacteroidales bacterium]